MSVRHLFSLSVLGEIVQHQVLYTPLITQKTGLTMSNEYFDVLIIGAGLSGIGAGCHMKKECPGKSFAILEGRAAIGGTWDLFRYPGIRSDSDMSTFGFNFKLSEAIFSFLKNCIFRKSIRCHQITNN